MASSRPFIATNLQRFLLELSRGRERGAVQKAREAGNPDGGQHGGSRRSPALCHAGRQGRLGAGEVDTLPPESELSLPERRQGIQIVGRMCPTSERQRSFDCIGTPCSDAKKLD